MTALSFGVSVGPGKYLGNMERSAYDANRRGAKQQWLSVQPEIRRDWRLPGYFLASQRVWGQWSPDRLADAGQFFLGGNRTIRGYRESEVSGDKGMGVSLEVLSPSLVTLMERIGACAPAAQIKDRSEPSRFVRPDVRLASFWDWGVVKRNGSLESYERKSTVMNGAGFGLRVRWGEWAHAQIDYAWRLRDTGVRKDDRKNGFLHASVNLGFY